MQQSTIAVSTRYNVVMQQDEVLVPIGRSEKAVCVWKGGRIQYHPNERKEAIMKEIETTRMQIRQHAESLVEKCLEAMKQNTKQKISKLVEKRAQELRTVPNKIKVAELLRRKGMLVITLDDEIYA